MFSKKKKFHYFVSGLNLQKNTPFMAEILLEEKVVSYDQIYQLINACAVRFDVYFDEIIIYNYDLLRPFRY